MEITEGYITAQTNEICPETEIWVVQKYIDGTPLIDPSITPTMKITKDSPMPQYKGKDVVWLMTRR